VVDPRVSIETKSQIEQDQEGWKAISAQSGLLRSSMQQHRSLAKLCVILTGLVGWTCAWGENVSASEVTSASVWGTVVFAGIVPQPKTVEMRGDPYCAKVRASHEPALRQDVVMTTSGRIANVVVYAKDVVGRPQSQIVAPLPPVIFELRSCMFVPHVVAVCCGQEVWFENKDDTVHTIHARRSKNPRFNFALLGTQSPSRSVRFPEPEVAVEVRCDVHPWENAFVAVFNHPYYAVTDSNGTFEIPEIPAGEYTLEAWHEKLGTVTQQVRLAPGERSSIQFVFGKPGDVLR